jgi:hypothetical protein
LKEKILPCNDQNKRSIIFAKISECKNYFPPIIKNITCDLKCQPGEIYQYDLKSNMGKCEKCPPNTFSEGGNKIINGVLRQWDKNIFIQVGIRTNCYVTPNGYIDSNPNINCEPFMINKDNSLLISGNTNLSGVKYIGEFIYGFHLKNQGQIKLKYKKDSIDDMYMRNGRFLLFLDFDLIIHDNKLESEWISFKKDLEPGDHTLVLIYDFWKDNQIEKSKNLKLEIEYLEITGLDDAAYECKKCFNSTSPVGSSECVQCDPNLYFDSVEGICKKCPDNKFSLRNSIGENSCIEKTPCNDYDYYISKVSNCVLGKKKIFYNLTEPIFCNDVGKNYKTEDVDCEINMPGYMMMNGEKKFCENGMYSNKNTDYVCKFCADGNFSPTVLIFDQFDGNLSITNVQNAFKNTCNSNIREVCMLNKGWQFKKDRIISGKYFPKDAEVTLELSIEVNIIDKFDPRIYYEIGIESLIDQENLSIHINDKLMYEYNSKNKDETFKNSEFSLNHGKNKIVWKYNRNKTDNIENSVFIKNIKIYGSDRGHKEECVRCPKGTFRKSSDGDVNCKLCGEGTTSNLEGI